MKCELAIAAVAALVAGALAGPAHAGRVYLYEKPGPSGESIEVEDNMPDLSVVPHPFQIKAVKIMRGGWLLCSEKNYEGNCLWAEVRIIRNLTTTPFQDDIRSLKTGGKVHNYPWPPRDLPPPPKAGARIILTAPIEDGRYAPIDEDEPDLAAAGVDFPVRAVKYRSSDNTAWQLCTAVNYDGRCILMFDGIDQLNAIFPETIASVRHVKAVSGPSW